MAYIFLSHSHTDKAFSRRLAIDLRREGHSVWIDEAEINIGDSLIGKIAEGLREVDFVAAVLSEHSIRSEWVGKELDIASNREINECRVVVLPLLIEDVALPNFLQGKFYGDFREIEFYDASFNQLLRALGEVEKPPAPDPDELELLRAELEMVKQRAEQEVKAKVRAETAAYLGKSDDLKAAIEEANADHPSHAPINNTYAFEIEGRPITLDYALWAIAKTARYGSHQLEPLLTLNNRWIDLENMMEAYSEMAEPDGRGVPLPVQT